MNEGDEFKIKKLPVQAQIFPVKGIVIMDVNGDHIDDLVLGGNHYAAEVETTRADAGIGLLLLADGMGQYQAETVSESGFFIPNDVIRMKKIKLVIDQAGVLIANNNGILQLFKNRENHQ